MAQLEVGGNLIRSINLHQDGYHPFTENPYFFFHYRGGSGAFEKFPAQGSVTLFVLAAEPGAKLKSNKEEITLATGCVVQMERPGNVMVTGGSSEFFAAGTADSAAATGSIKITSPMDVKRVSKPWGYEMWLNGEHPKYAFKKIFIKAGTKTSLQYHKFKRETMIFTEGTAALHYKSNPAAQIDSVTAADVSAQKIQTGQLVDVMPQHLHRVEAVSDIMLFEVSTPHLDDVIRVSDDANRANGRIASEHKPQ